MAKPSALTDEVRDEIGRRLSSGCTLEVAAEAVGVDRRTIQTWLAIGRDARELDDRGGKLTARQAQCLDLLKAEQAARAELRVKALASIQKAALTGTWQAGAWLLERLFPDEFAAQKRSNGGAGGRPKGASSAPDRQPPPRLKVVGD